VNIVLIGYRGTGKTAVGVLVAERLRMRYVGMDQSIVERAGMSIPEIVERHGWQGFRDLESAVARELAGLDDAVIDTGGGIIERPENIEALRANACIIWLKASVETIVSRIEGGTQRPSLTGAKTFTEEVAEVLGRRTPMYQRAAQHEIDTDQFTAEDVADRIVEISTKEIRATTYRSDPG
jgi:shikimate kinase